MSKNYIPVLCCSGKKTKDEFCYNSQTIKFVASPQIASQKGIVFYKPDDKMPGGNTTWRDLVLEQKASNLIPAYLLYKHDIYRELYHKFGNRFYILSAGWGIIRADFKIPAYDITYSTAPNVPEYARRKDRYGWKDINHLKEDAGNFNKDTEIILFAGSDYVPPFCDMTQSISYKKIIMYKSKKIIQQRGFVYEYYETKTNTNWQYEAVENFLNNYTNSNTHEKMSERERTHEQKKSNEQQKSHTTPREIFAFFNCPYPCDEIQLKKAYLEMIKQYHPDKVNGMGPEIKEVAEKKTKEINDMYEKALSYIKR